MVDNDGLLLLGVETLEHLHTSLSVEPAITINIETESETELNNW